MEYFGLRGRAGFSDQEIKEEIIEIGAVCLDSAFEPADRFLLLMLSRVTTKRCILISGV